MLLVSFSVTCVLLVGYFVYLLLLKLRVRKPYSHFVSHSRVEAGATARWFQLALGKVLGGTDRICFDTRNTMQIGEVVATVGSAGMNAGGGSTFS